MSAPLKIISYPKHIGDWRSGTAEMTLIQEGAYSRLCDEYFNRGGSLPKLDGCLRICHAITKAEVEAVKYVLNEKFLTTGTGHSHPGMDDRIAAIRAQSKKMADRAAKAAHARWGK